MRTLSLLLTALAIGCGPSDDALMSELDDSDLEKLCNELAGDEREVSCDYDGVELTIEVSSSAEECIEDNASSYYEGCDVTVGNLRDCNDAWAALSDDEICSLEAEWPSECDPLLECAFGL